MLQGQRKAVGSGASAPGLVPSSTSQTGCASSPLSAFLKPVPAGSFEVDAVAARLKRMRSGVMTWARVCTEWTGTTGQRWRPTFVTLTYRASASWGPKQITAYLACVASWASRRGIRVPYTWVLELTKAGVPHYHVLLWVPKRYSLPKPDKSGWWREGSSRIESSVYANAAAYMSKYISKGGVADGGPQLPKGSRISGRGGLPRNCVQAREARWWRLPAWMRDAIPWTLGVLARRASQVFNARVTGPGGRLISWVAETGEFFESPWASRFCPITRRLHVWRVA